MGTILVTLLFLVSTNPMVVDKPTIYVDGYIEINHYWDQDKGDVILDQLLVWNYNKELDRFDILHWQMIKDGREIDRISPFNYKRNLDELTSNVVSNNLIVSEINMTLAVMLANYTRQKIKDEIKQQKLQGKLIFKKELDWNPDETIIFAASKWLGSKGFGYVDFNENTQMYETMVEIQGEPLWIHTKHFKQSDTLFDPETEYKTVYERPSGSTRMSKHPMKKLVR